MALEELLQRDDSHPIPDLEVIDIHGVKKGGGSELIIIIASPLQDDVRSLERLMCKIERYLLFAKSPECEADSGFATTENTKLLVRMHPASSKVAFELLERCKPWVLENDATLEVDTRGIGDPVH